MTILSVEGGLGLRRQTCKGVEGGAAQHRRCKASGCSDIGGSRRQRPQDVLQQQRLSCPCADNTGFIFQRADPQLGQCMQTALRGCTQLKQVTPSLTEKSGASACLCDLIKEGLCRRAKSVSRKDRPAQPVKKTLWPASTRAAMLCCSADSGTSSSSGSCRCISTL